MLYIKSLNLINHRCFKSLRLSFNQGTNFLIGGNAQGKTSILESIYMIATGKSFRLRSIKGTVNHNADSCQIQALVNSGDNTTTEWNYSWCRNRGKITVDGTAMTTRSALQQLPIKLYLTQDLSDLHKPCHRRKILDWVAYYCFQDFGYHYNQYQRLISSYNKSIYQNFPSEYREALSKNIYTHALAIDSCRSQALEWIGSYFNEISDYKITTIYYRGWKNDFNNYLGNQNLLLKCGPQTADVSFFVKDKNIINYSSRGQLKVFLYCLFMSQALVLREYKAVECIHLVDDFFAELDDNYASRLLGKFDIIKMQTMITGLPNAISEAKNYINISRL